MFRRSVHDLQTDHGSVREVRERFQHEPSSTWNICCCRPHASILPTARELLTYTLLPATPLRCSRAASLRIKLIACARGPTPLPCSSMTLRIHAPRSSISIAPYVFKNRPGDVTEQQQSTRRQKTGDEKQKTRKLGGVFCVLFSTRQRKEPVRCSCSTIPQRVPAYSSSVAMLNGACSSSRTGRERDARCRMQAHSKKKLDKITYEYQAPGFLLVSSCTSVL